MVVNDHSAKVVWKWSRLRILSIGDAIEEPPQLCRPTSKPLTLSETRKKLSDTLKALGDGMYALQLASGSDSILRVLQSEDLRTTFNVRRFPCACIANLLHERPDAQRV